MSTSRNTAGRLKTRRPVGVDFLETEEGGKLVASLYYHEATSEADARRLVACWNACEGVTTEHIEKLSEGPSLPALVEYLRGRLDRAESALECARDQREEYAAEAKRLRQELAALKGEQK